MDIKRSGTQPSRKGPADWFTGAVRIDPLFDAPDPGRVGGASVTFEPGAPTAWHTHPLGRTLIATAGCGWARRWGRPGRNDPPRRRRLVPARRQALAWRNGDDRDDAHRHPREARRQGSRLDGTGHGRPVPRLRLGLRNTAGGTPDVTHSRGLLGIHSMCYEKITISDVQAPSKVASGREKEAFVTKRPCLLRNVLAC